MLRRPPIVTRTDTRVPTATFFRSLRPGADGGARGPQGPRLSPAARRRAGPGDLRARPGGRGGGGARASRPRRGGEGVVPAPAAGRRGRPRRGRAEIGRAHV